MTEISQTEIADAVRAAIDESEGCRARIGAIGRPQSEELAQSLRELIISTALVAFLENLPEDATATDISDAMKTYAILRALSLATDLLTRQMMPTPDVLTAIDGEGTADLWALGEQIAKAEEVCAQEYTAFGKASKEAEDRLVALKAQLLRAGGKP